MQPFDSKIRSVVNLFSYPVWFIVRDEDNDCTCVDFTTRTADTRCRKCFGLGKKITLIKAKAARQHDRVTLRGTGIGFSEVNPSEVFYTNAKTGIKEADIIVDRDYACIVKEVYTEHSDAGRSVYYKIVTAPLKNNVREFLEMFFGHLKGAGSDG